MSHGASRASNGLHVAIIMDGNGRWAEARGLPRQAGHRAGVKTVRRIVEAAPALGIGTLTLFAFSSDNWSRPPAEVRALLGLLRRYVGREAETCLRSGVRLSFIGRRDRIPGPLSRAMAEAEQRTARGRRLHLRIAVDYSARDTIVRAALASAADPPADAAAFLECLARAAGSETPAPDVDLLVRTGGEQRLSDFLLFECAYAELLFLDRPWPDLRAEDLAACVREFHRRERRFGGLPERAAS